MLHIMNEASRYHVTVAFEQSALSFPFSEGATMAALAERIGDLADWRHSRPLAISLRFKRTEPAKRVFE